MFQWNWTRSHYTWFGCWMVRERTSRSHANWPELRARPTWRMSVAICLAVWTGWRAWGCWKAEGFSTSIQGAGEQRAALRADAVNSTLGNCQGMLSVHLDCLGQVSNSSVP